MLLCSGRIDYGKRGEQLAIEAAVAGQQASGLLLRVGSDEKVCQDAAPLPSAPSIKPPGAAREKCGFPCQRLDADLVAFQEVVAFFPAFEMDRQLRIDDVAH